MQPPQCLVFGPFRLDLHDERLWRGHEATPLSPKTFAVLRCLVSQAGQLVTKDALLAAVWPETVVSESILTVTIRTLRRVLGDQARAPRFIETVHGRGYRFIAPVSTTMPPERPTMMGRPRRSLPSTVSRPPLFVGRDAELAQLAQWWTTVQRRLRSKPDGHDHIDLSPTYLSCGCIHLWHPSPIAPSKTNAGRSRTLLRVGSCLC